MFYLVDVLRTSNPGAASQVTLRELLQRGRERSQVIQNFCNKEQVIWTSRHYCELKETKVMLKILQARLQQYVNRELPDVQARFRKDRGTRDQIANIWWTIEKAREFQKNIHFCFIDYAKASDCMLLLLLSRFSCVRLCNPIDGSPPGSTIPGILQARALEWVAISFSNAWKWKVKVKSLSRVRLLATPWIAAYQAPPSIGFSRQEHWSGVPLPSPLWLCKSQKTVENSSRDGNTRSPDLPLKKSVCRPGSNS